MTRDSFAITADMLHAYADGQLDADGRAAVERYLAAHPDAAADVESWQRQNEAMRALFPPAADESIPPELSPRNIAREVRTGRRQRFTNIAAAIVLLGLGSTVGWFGRDYMTATQAASDSLIEAAVTAHTLYIKEKTRAVEVAADAPNLMTWLSNRITTPINAPDLSAEGFTFLGGRLLPSDPGNGLPGPAAQLMYENAEAQRLTIYITPPLPDKDEEWEYRKAGGADAYYWSTPTITCTVVASVPEAEVKALGHKIAEQLTWRAESGHDW
ncbi:MAG TPA: anti-sigma factor [Devosia sp.]|jgi:anti-sigma factor RsiW|nr:anti-sigma factor [Devosia sp.]